MCQTEEGVSVQLSNWVKLLNIMLHMQQTRLLTSYNDRSRSWGYRDALQM